MTEEFDYEAGNKAASELFAAIELSRPNSLAAQIGYLEGWLCIEAAKNPELRKAMELKAAEIRDKSAASA